MKRIKKAQKYNEERKTREKTKYNEDKNRRKLKKKQKNRSSASNYVNGRPNSVNTG